MRIREADRPILGTLRALRISRPIVPIRPVSGTSVVLAIFLPIEQDGRGWLVDGHVRGRFVEVFGACCGRNSVLSQQGTFIVQNNHALKTVQTNVTETFFLFNGRSLFVPPSPPHVPLNNP